MGTSDNNIPAPTRAQSAIEYLTTYAWALIIIAIILSILYLYLSTPQQLVPNLCNFVSSNIYCIDLIAFNPMQVGNTVTVVTLLTNSNSYPIINPELYSSVQGVNSSAYACIPGGRVYPAATMLCLVSLPISEQVGGLLSGSLYLKAQLCSSLSCSSAYNQTYVASFATHVQIPPSYATYVFKFLPDTYTPNVSDTDQLHATIKLFGVPLQGAEVNYSTNDSAFNISNVSLTNKFGVGGATLHSDTAGNVAVTAEYLGISNTVIVDYMGNYTGNASTGGPYLMNLAITPSSARDNWYACSQYDLYPNNISYPEGDNCTGESPWEVPAGARVDQACIALQSSINNHWVFKNWTINGVFSGASGCVTLPHGGYFVRGDVNFSANFYRSATTSTTVQSSTTTGKSTTVTFITTTGTTSTIGGHSTSTTSIPVQYTLTMECAGPVFSDCGISPTGGFGYNYPAGSKVTISAPATSSAPSCNNGEANFQYWTGEGGGYSGGSLSAQIVINNNIKETATYACE